MYSETSLELEYISDKNVYQNLIKYTNLKSLTISYSTLCKLPLIPSLEKIYVIDTFIEIPDNLPNLKYVKADLIECIYINKDKYPNVILDYHPEITVLAAYDVNDDDSTIIEKEYMLFKSNKGDNFNEQSIYMFIMFMSIRFSIEKIMEVLKKINDKYTNKFFDLTQDDN